MATIREQRSQEWWNVSKWTLLGLLIEKPDYAYHLSERYETEALRFHEVLPPLNDSTIDKYVKRMERDGYAERLRLEPTPRSSTMVRIVYKATAEGARAHREWLFRDLQRGPQQVDMLRRWVGSGGDRQRLQVWEAYRRRLLGQLENLPPLDAMSRHTVVRLSPEEREARHAVLYERTRIEADLEFLTVAIKDLRLAVELGSADKDVADGGEDRDDRAAVA